MSLSDLVIRFGVPLGFRGKPLQNTVGTDYRQELPISIITQPHRSAVDDFVEATILDELCWIDLKLPLKGAAHPTAVSLTCVLVIPVSQKPIRARPFLCPAVESQTAESAESRFCSDGSEVHCDLADV